MATIRGKVEHVRRSTQSRPHECHWPGCRRQVPPAMWGCPTHWFRLPMRLRSRIWATYRPGQEDDGQPSPEYVAAARAVLDWIEAGAQR